MFYYHMSYSEIVHALEDSSEKKELSKTAWICFKKSLQDPFVAQMLRSYPLSKKAHRLIARTIASFRAHNMELLSDNVHEILYWSQREKTAQWLNLSYGQDTESRFDIITELNTLIKKAFETPEIQRELILEEESRFIERNKSGHKATWDMIQNDFQDYLEHLSALKKNGATYVFGVLTNILKRITTLQDALQQDAIATLIRSLDDSRTAYHALLKHHIPGKTYSCPKGLEERLLDHHGIYCPAVQREASIVEKFVEAITSPFSYRNPETSGILFSREFYSLYLEAAGYRPGAIPSLQWDLKTAGNKELLKMKWAQQYPKQPQQLLTTFSLLSTGGVRADLPLEKFILPCIEFLKEEDVLCITRAYEVSVQSPQIKKSMKISTKPAMSLSPLCVQWRDITYLSQNSLNITHFFYGTLLKLLMMRAF